MRSILGVPNVTVAELSGGPERAGIGGSIPSLPPPLHRCTFQFWYSSCNQPHRSLWLWGLQCLEFAVDEVSLGDRSTCSIGISPKPSFEPKLLRQWPGTAFRPHVQGRACCVSRRGFSSGFETKAKKVLDGCLPATSPVLMFVTGDSSGMTFPERCRCPEPRHPGSLRRLRQTTDYV